MPRVGKYDLRSYLFWQRKSLICFFSIFTSFLYHVTQKVLMSTNWRGFDKHCFEMFNKGKRSEHEDCYETFKKLVRNSEFSKNG